MLITLSCRTAICQSVTEVSLTGVATLGAVSHIFNCFNQISNNNNIEKKEISTNVETKMHKTVCLSTLLYRSEIWVMFVTHKDRVISSERKYLRRKENNNYYY